jgi:hypothetical protein
MLFGAGLVVVVLGAALLWVLRTPAAEVAQPSAATAPAQAPQRSKPAWAEGAAFRETDDAVFAWAHAESVEAAENTARQALATQLATSSPRAKDFARKFGTPTLSGEALAESLSRVLGEAPRRETSDTWVRLSVSKARFQAARADFARELTFRGATLSMIPPQLGPPAGALAVVSCPGMQEQI